MTFFHFKLFREFAKTIKRPFSVRYNPYTQSVDILKDTTSINNVVEELRHELDIIGDALNRLNKQLGVWRLQHCLTPQQTCSLMSVSKFHCFISPELNLPNWFRWSFYCYYVGVISIVWLLWLNIWLLASGVLVCYARQWHLSLSQATHVNISLFWCLHRLIYWWFCFR